jgi:hypothetical protein
MVATATFFSAFAGVLAAPAADSQLLGLVMPDAKMLAGVNVDQAKASPFGLYVLTQMQSNNTDLQQLIALTGFDPTKDVHEVLAATNGTPGSKSPLGLVLARGNFNPATITALATSKGALTEVHGGVTIIEDSSKAAGIAFLNNTLVMAGDLANVKAAIDRPGNGQTLPAAVSVLANQWSAAQDAWVITTVAPAALVPAGTLGGNAGGLFQQVQQAAAGVKFGNSVVATAAVTVDTVANATQMANALQFLANMAQMQSQSNPQLTSLAKGLLVGAQGSVVNITLTMPEAQFQELLQQPKKAASPQVVVKKYTRTASLAFGRSRKESVAYAHGSAGSLQGRDP